VRCAMRIGSFVHKVSGKIRRHREGRETDQSPSREVSCEVEDEPPLVRHNSAPAKSMLSRGLARPPSGMAVASSLPTPPPGRATPGAASPPPARAAPAAAPVAPVGAPAAGPAAPSGQLAPEEEHRIYAYNPPPDGAAIRSCLKRIDTLPTLSRPAPPDLPLSPTRRESSPNLRRPCPSTAVSRSPEPPPAKLGGVARQRTPPERDGSTPAPVTEAIKPVRPKVQFGDDGVAARNVIVYEQEASE